MARCALMEREIRVKGRGREECAGGNCIVGRSYREIVHYGLSDICQLICFLQHIYNA